MIHITNKEVRREELTFVPRDISLELGLEQEVIYSGATPVSREAIERGLVSRPKYKPLEGETPRFYKVERATASGYDVTELDEEVAQEIRIEMREGTRSYRALEDRIIRQCHIDQKMIEE